MKKNRRILSAMLAVMLLVSMLAVSASAATYKGKTCTATVTKASTSIETLEVGTSRTSHVTGSTNTIPYNSPAFLSNPYSANFVEDYRSDLLQAFYAEGFSQRVSLPAKTGSVTVAANLPTGKYAAMRCFTYGTGTWKAATSVGTTTGTIGFAPISVVIREYLVG